MKYDSLNYDELEVIEWFLKQDPQFQINIGAYQPIRDRLLKEINNELAERDDRHWEDK